MLKHKFAREAFRVVMLAVIASFAGCDGDKSTQALLPSPAGDSALLQQSIAAEQRHFDVYRSYRSAFDATTPATGNATAGEQSCIPNVMFND